MDNSIQMKKPYQKMMRLFFYPNLCSRRRRMSQTTSVHADLWSVCRKANLKPRNRVNAKLARVLVMCLFRFKIKPNLCSRRRSMS